MYSYTQHSLHSYVHTISHSYMDGDAIKFSQSFPWTEYIKTYTAQTLSVTHTNTRRAQNDKYLKMKQIKRINGAERQNNSSNGTSSSTKK